MMIEGSEGSSMPQRRSFSLIVAEVQLAAAGSSGVARDRGSHDEQIR